MKIENEIEFLKIRMDEARVGCRGRGAGRELQLFERLESEYQAALEEVENPALAAVKPVCSDLAEPGDGWLNPDAVKLVGARIAELEKQRDGLLAALEKLADYVDLTHYASADKMLQTKLDHARAAISAATGKASA